MSDFMKEQLTEKAQQAYSVQPYEKAPQIDGVILKDLTQFSDDGGFLIELGRFDHGLHQHFPDFELKQINFTHILPGVIKAYHLHFKQDDVWFVPPTARLLIVLNDQRKDSSTQDVTMRFVLGGGKAKLLYIPHGVAHGVTNTTGEPGVIMYFVNQQFNIEDPDEGRLPWDFLGEEIWQVTKG